MENVKRVLALFVTASMLAMPAAAEEAADAPATWRELFGYEGVVALELPSGTAKAGEQFQGSIQFTPEAQVQDVSYQMCEIGNICFAANIPMEQDPADPDRWTFDTSVMHDFAPNLLGPYEFQPGARYGIQFFVCDVTVHNGSACPWNEEFGKPAIEDYHWFPEGLDFDDPLWDTDYLAWSETHYFGIDVIEGDAATPGPTLTVAGLALLIVAARRRF